MTISILDSVSKGFTNTSQTHTESHTLTSGNNRIVIVGALLNDAAARSFTSATYGGNAMTEIVTIIEVGQNLRASLYRLKEADLPSNGANDAVVTAQIAVSDIGCFVMTIQDVDQTALVEDSDSEQGASAATSSLTLTITNNSFQINQLAHRSDTGTLTWGGGQIEEWDEDIGGTRAGASSQIGASAGEEAIAWTSTVAQRFAHVAASFVAADILVAQNTYFIT